VAEVTGPSLRNSGRNSGFRRIPEQINLALEWFNSDACSAESEEIRGIPRIRKNEASQKPEYKTELVPGANNSGRHVPRREGKTHHLCPIRLCFFPPPPPPQHSACVWLQDVALYPSVSTDNNRNNETVWRQRRGEQRAKMLMAATTKVGVPDDNDGSEGVKRRPWWYNQP
jgi:hypothetical protein